MRFRFTIRDLLWLTVVVAMAVAWRLDRNRWQQDWNAAHAGLILQVNELQGQLTPIQRRNMHLEFLLSQMLKESETNSNSGK